MEYELVSKKTMSDMVAMRERHPAIEAYLGLEKQLEKDKKTDRPELVRLRESGEIGANSKVIDGPAYYYFKEIEVADGEKLSNAQILAIASQCPDLFKEVVTAHVIDEAIKRMAGKRSEDAKTIQSINRGKCVRTVYSAVIGEAKN